LNVESSGDLLVVSVGQSCRQPQQQGACRCGHSVRRFRVHVRGPARRPRTI